MRSGLLLFVGKRISGKVRPLRGVHTAAVIAASSD